MTGISGPNGTASFKYDHRGRRIEKTVNGQATSFLYDRAQAIAELQGSSIGATYLTGLRIDEVLARYTNQGNRTLLTDALGSVLIASDDNQTNQAVYGYSAFGEQTQVGENGNTLQYSGRENDNSGLYYYRSRYFDPQLKRFIAQDSIGLAGGVNWYAYGRNNPLMYVDPFGFYWEYWQQSGNLYYVDPATGDVSYVGNGYSGHGAGVNNPDMQDVRNTGPIPTGDYNIGDARNGSKTGPMTLDLDPREGTDTYGRDLFRIHGDNGKGNRSASEGCIILPPDVRKQINDSPDRKLTVR